MLYIKKHIATVLLGEVLAACPDAALDQESLATWLEYPPDANMGDLAFYIEDLTEHGNYTVCGTVTEIVEKTTKTGKPMFVIHIDDTTGKMSGIYFSKKRIL